MNLLVAAQVYSVREEAEANFEQTMHQLAEMGYDGVELAGLYGKSAKEIRDCLDRVGLQAISAHVPINDFEQDLNKTVQIYQEIGCKYVAIPYLDKERWYGGSRYPETLETIVKISQKCQEAGMELLYHNHNFEFERLSDGRLLMEHLLDQLPAELMGITLDTYWVQAGGADIYQWLDILQDRIPCVHFKDMAVSGWNPIMAPVGDGNLNFPAIVKKLNELGKTKYALVEQDTCQGSPFDCLQRSHDYLRSLGL